MPNITKTQLQDFEKILLRLCDDETEVQPEVVLSIYQQLFEEKVAYIKSYANEDIDRVFEYLKTLKQFYRLVTIEDIKSHMESFDRITGMFINSFDELSDENKNNLSDQVYKCLEKDVSSLSNLSVVNAFVDIKHAKEINKKATKTIKTSSVKKSASKGNQKKITS